MPGINTKTMSIIKRGISSNRNFIKLTLICNLVSPFSRCSKNPNRCSRFYFTDVLQWKQPQDRSASGENLGVFFGMLFLKMERQATFRLLQVKSFVVITIPWHMFSLQSCVVHKTSKKVLFFHKSIPYKNI